MGNQNISTREEFELRFENGQLNVYRRNDGQKVDLDPKQKLPYVIIEESYLQIPRDRLVEKAIPWKPYRIRIGGKHKDYG